MSTTWNDYFKNCSVSVKIIKRHIWTSNDTWFKTISSAKLELFSDNKLRIQLPLVKYPRRTNPLVRHHQGFGLQPFRHIHDFYFSFSSDVVIWETPCSHHLYHYLRNHLLGFLRWSIDWTIQNFLTQATTPRLCYSLKFVKKSFSLTQWCTFLKQMGRGTICELLYRNVSCYVKMRNGFYDWKVG